MSANKGGARRIRNLPFEDYLAIDAVNASLLKKAYRSGLEARYWLDHEDDKRAYAIGRGVHCSVYEPERFAREYGVYSGVRRGEAFEALKAEHPEMRVILSPKEADEILTISQAVRNHHLASWFLDGEAETTILWTDLRTGLHMKARIDLIGLCHWSDLKTTKARTEGEWCNEFARYLYDLQLALYQDALSLVGLGDLPCIVPAVQNRPPYDVFVTYVDEEKVLSHGREKVAVAIDKLIECYRTGEWSGLCPDGFELNLPDWAVSKEMLEADWSVTNG